MVAIPKRTDPTLEAMFRQMEKKKRDKRNYLGASYIGKPCDKEIWMTYNNYPAQPHDAASLMNIEDGHRTEKLTADRLKGTPQIKLTTHVGGKQLGFTAFDGRFQGHYDGEIMGLYQAPKAAHIWENKAVGDTRFKKFEDARETHGEKHALAHWDFTNYVQGQMYMHFSGIERHYLTVSKAGGRGYGSARTNYDEDIANHYVDRAKRLIDAKSPPSKLHEDMDNHYDCRICDFRMSCQGWNK